MFSFQVLLVFALSSTAAAQFGFFEQMFQGGQQRPNHQQRRQNVPSDSEWYQGVYQDGFAADYASAYCDKYLCPGTLACVHFPHHCPCPFPQVEDKVELGEGGAVCASKGGYKTDETIKKIELARKGLI